MRTYLTIFVIPIHILVFHALAIIERESICNTAMGSCQRGRVRP